MRLGLRGVKLGPIYQNIHPTDPRMMEVYEFCQAHKLPIMIHQGTTFVRTGPLKFALPDSARGRRHRVPGSAR